MRRRSPRRAPAGGRRPGGLTPRRPRRRQRLRPGQQDGGGVLDGCDVHLAGHEYGKRARSGRRARRTGTSVAASSDTRRESAGLWPRQVILGNIANLIASWDEARNEFRGKIEAVEEFALRYEIDPTLVTRIKRYYDLTWEKFQGADDINTILADLPSQLKMLPGLLKVPHASQFF